MPTFLLQDLVDAEIVIVLSINHGTNQISMECSEKSSKITNGLAKVESLWEEAVPPALQSVWTETLHVTLILFITIG